MCNTTKYNSRKKVNDSIRDLKLDKCVWIYYQWELDKLKEELDLQSIEYTTRDCTDYWEVRLV